MRIDPPAHILVTGVAGFIGFHVARTLLDQGYRVTGVDSVNDYYDPSLKRARLSKLTGITFGEFDIANSVALAQLFESSKFDAIVHLAAQAGVRYSIDNPSTYIQANLVGTGNLLELAKRAEVDHFVYASSSSVYGMNRSVPFGEDDPVDHPISLYAATKKANELMAHTYSHLFGLPTTGLRFFTVYGPWGRPDMAAFKFTEAILAGRPIDVYNKGQMRRDFTYIDDIVAGTIAVLQHPAQPDPSFDPYHPSPSSSDASYRVYNIGNHESVELLDFIGVLEESLGKKAQINMLPLQPGDVLETYANIDALQKAVGYQPTIPIQVGIPRFVEWYRDYFKA
jgi:UDP-glucuronate 4-epimerase